mmetsp:Transcript_13407/g.20125  ORF Transcript_13407/g.20125 Transcript_13407/m.20125 type:complete len:440 (+) Transcript_13407:27-1346(+)
MLTNAIICNIPVILLVSVASLDAADKQLLASSFPVLERTLHLNVKTLGYFSLFSNLSYALSLPFWGYLVHKHGIRNVYILLSIACASWGAATIGIAAMGSSIFGQAVMRSINGWMLGSILPLSQTLMVELVPSAMRGRAFGIMTVFEKLAGTLATTMAVYWDEKWQCPFWVLGLFSILLGWLVYRNLDPRKHAYVKEDNSHGKIVNLTLRQIVQRIARLPAFRCLVAQGVFGGTPWDMMSFQLLLLEWRGFTKEQIICIQLTSGLAGTAGGWLGGTLGDLAASSHSTKGRITIALISVLGGIPVYGLFLYSTSYYWTLFYINLFHVLASWAPAAALRPICADLTRNPSERAQIVSMWIVLEKASAAVFGAPLVGFLTNKMLTSKDSALTNEEKSEALAHQLFFLSSLFWSICAFFWILMARTLTHKGYKRSKEDSDHLV